MGFHSYVWQHKGPLAESCKCVWPLTVSGQNIYIFGRKFTACLQLLVLSRQCFPAGARWSYYTDLHHQPSHHRPLSALLHDFFADTIYESAKIRHLIWYILLYAGCQCWLDGVCRNRKVSISSVCVAIYVSDHFIIITLWCSSLTVLYYRYLAIAHPLWYRFRFTIKSSVAICVVVWVLPVFFFWFPRGLPYLLLLPFPLFMFFLVGIVKALSGSISVSSDEKRRIVGTSVLVLLIYTLLILPLIILLLIVGDAYEDIVASPASLPVQLCPLADLLLYVFIKKGIIEKRLASECCCRMDSNNSNRMESNDTSVHQCKWWQHQHSGFTDSHKTRQICRLRCIINRKNNKDKRGERDLSCYISFIHLFWCFSFMFSVILCSVIVQKLLKTKNCG